MSSHSRKYNTDALFYFPLIAAGANDFDTSPTIAAGDAKVFTDTLIFTNVSCEAVAFSSMSFLSSNGQTLTGATSGATCTFMFAVITSGTIGGGDAAGVLFVKNVSGTFQAENLDGAAGDIMTIVADFTAGLFGEVGNGNFVIALTAAEMSCKRGVIHVIDSATKEWEDQAIHFSTSGHASAEVAFDFSAANVTLADGAHGGTSAVFTFERIIGVATTANASAVDLTGQGTGHGLNAIGGGTSGNGILATGGSTNGSGIKSEGVGAGAGMDVFNTSGTGHGLSADANSGDGISASTVSGADIRGAITGNLSGSVGSLTGHTNQTVDHTAGIAAITASGPTKAEMDTAHGLLPTQSEITGGAYALDTDALGRMRIVDGTGAGELDTLSGAIVQVNQLGAQAKLDVNVEADTAITDAALATATNLATVDTVIDSILVLLDDARGEPGQGAPPVNPDMVTKVDYLYKAWRNKKTQSATEFKLYADDTTTVDQKTTVSDDGSIFTQTEMATGA